MDNLTDWLERLEASRNSKPKLVRKLMEMNGLAGYNMYATINPKNWPRTMRYFKSTVRNLYQRTQKNFGLIDIWEYHAVNAKAQTAAIKQLKEMAHGYPSGLIENWDGPFQPAEGEDEGAMARWLEVLQTIEDGWQAAVDMDSTFDTDGYMALKEKFEKGMALYVKYYMNLWD